jgi:hypothetical protein
MAASRLGKHKFALIGLWNIRLISSRVGDDFEERLFDDPAHYRYNAIASESGLVRPR